MPPPRPGQHHSVVARLAARPGAFDFFQAMRVLERRGAAAGRDAVGQDRAPERESVSLRVQPALRFASAPVVRAQVADGDPAGGPPPELTVSFMGLTGADGILPQHYTALILSRLRLKDASLRDWLDLFHHRALSLFVRAWEKAHWPAAVERHRAEGAAGDDAVTGGAFAAAGFGTGGLRGRLAVPDDALVYYAALLGRGPRPASGLEQILSEYFGWPVAVRPLSGHWLYLDEGNRTRLPGAGGGGANAGLGRDAIAGQRVWDVQSKVRIVVGPLDYAGFRSLLPGGDARAPLRDLARLYLGLELDADVQVVLEPDAVPPCSLDYDERAGPRLGRNAWVRTHGFGAPVGDAVFAAG